MVGGSNSGLNSSLLDNQGLLILFVGFFLKKTIFISAASLWPGSEQPSRCGWRFSRRGSWGSWPPAPHQTRRLRMDIRHHINWDYHASKFDVSLTKIIQINWGWSTEFAIPSFIEVFRKSFREFPGPKAWKIWFEDLKNPENPQHDWDLGGFSILLRILEFSAKKSIPKSNPHILSSIETYTDLCSILTSNSVIFL